MRWFEIWIRGLVMGAADAVPGVSGGTVAFLTGIYERWIGVLTAIRPDLWTVFRREGFRGLWLRLDGGFVVPLLVGILMSLFTFAYWIKDWLDVFPERVWGFFLGLVFAMGIAMLSDLRSSMRSKDWAWLVVGIVTALLGLQTPQVGKPLALGVAFRRGDGTLGDAIARNFGEFSVVTCGLISGTDFCSQCP